MKQTRWATEQQELAKKVQTLSEYIQVEEDPMEVLLAIRDLREMLRDLEDCAAREAKSNDWTWQKIADAMGISRQAAHERYSVNDSEKMREHSEARAKAHLERFAVRRAAQR